MGEFHFEKLFNARNSIYSNPNNIYQNQGDYLIDNFNNFILNTIKDYCEAYPLCGDRTPCSILESIIPGKKYILIQRDGRDCLVSWIYHLIAINYPFGDDMSKKLKSFRADPNFFEEDKSMLLNEYWTRSIAKQWQNRVLYDLKAIEQVKKKEIDIEVLSLKYEDLLIDVENYRKRMYDFLGLDFAAAKSLTDLTTAGFKEHNVLSHYRKGEGGRWKQYFSDEKMNWFESEAKEALEILGYETYT